MARRGTRSSTWARTPSTATGRAGPSSARSVSTHPVRLRRSRSTGCVSAAALHRSRPDCRRCSAPPPWAHGRRRRWPRLRPHGATRPTTVADPLHRRLARPPGARPEGDAIARGSCASAPTPPTPTRSPPTPSSASSSSRPRGGVLYVHGGWSAIYSRLAERVEVRTGVAVTALDATPRSTSSGRLDRDPGPHGGGGHRASDAMSSLLGGRRWETVGTPVTAACLDLVTGRVPAPGLRPRRRRPDVRDHPVAPGCPGPRTGSGGGCDPLRRPLGARGPPGARVAGRLAGVRPSTMSAPADSSPR